jgi:4-hydroxybenzoate polyprenyltransferase
VTSAFVRTLVHLRPRSWPIVFAHFAAGAAVTGSAAMSDGHSILARVVAGGLLWAVCLNGGTLAINSAYDRDSGDVGYLNNPPPVPRRLGASAMALMLIGFIGAIFLSIPFAICYGICVVMSVAYSVPPIRLKSVAGADLVINMIGYGGLTFLAGAFAPHIAPTDVAGNLWSSTYLLSASFAFLFGTFYPMTQIYQIPEDRERGDRTLVIMVGVRNSLRLAVVAIALSCLCQVAAAWLRGVMPWGFIAIVGTSLAWGLFTIDWMVRGDNYPAQKGLYRALKLWAVSDIVIASAFWFGT